jgi:hypothetical protein
MRVEMKLFIVGETGMRSTSLDEVLGNLRALVID